MKIRDLLRHAAIAAFGGGGLFLCLFALWVAGDLWGKEGWLLVFVMVPVLFFAAVLLLAVGYWVLRREYQSVCALGCGLGSLIFWALIVNVPMKLLIGPEQSNYHLDSGWEAAKALIWLVCFACSFKISNWFNRVTFSFLCRHVQDGPRDA